MALLVADLTSPVLVGGDMAWARLDRLGRFGILQFAGGVLHWTQS